MLLETLNELGSKWQFYPVFEMYSYSVTVWRSSAEKSNIKKKKKDLPFGNRCSVATAYPHRADSQCPASYAKARSVFPTERITVAGREQAHLKESPVAHKPCSTPGGWQTPLRRHLPSLPPGCQVHKAAMAMADGLCAWPGTCDWHLVILGLCAESSMCASCFCPLWPRFGSS